MYPILRIPYISQENKKINIRVRSVRSRARKRNKNIPQSITGTAFPHHNGIHKVGAVPASPQFLNTRGERALSLIRWQNKTTYNFYREHGLWKQWEWISIEYLHLQIHVQVHRYSPYGVQHRLFKFSRHTYSIPICVLILYLFPNANRVPQPWDLGGSFPHRTCTLSKLYAIAPH